MKLSSFVLKVVSSTRFNKKKLSALGSVFMALPKPVWASTKQLVLSNIWLFAAFFFIVLASLIVWGIWWFWWRNHGDPAKEIVAGNAFKSEVLTYLTNNAGAILQDKYSSIPFYIAITDSSEAERILEDNDLHSPGTLIYHNSCNDEIEALKLYTGAECAVLLLSQRFLMSNTGTESLNAILEIMAKNRPQRLANGFLVFVECAGVGHRTLESAQFAAVAGNVARSLFEYSGIRMAMHLIVCSADTLNGFCDFFADNPDVDTQEPWGLVLPETKDQSFSEHEFEVEKQLLINNVNVIRDRLMGRKLLHSRREAILFPYELDLFFEACLCFIRKTFENNNGKAYSFIHSLFLTSSQASGRHFDLLAECIALENGVLLGKSSAKVITTSSLFICGLIQRIGAEPHLVGVNKLARTHQRWRCLLMGGGALFGVLAIFAVCIYNIYHCHILCQETDQVLAEYTKNRNDVQTSFRSGEPKAAFAAKREAYIDALAKLRLQLNVVDDGTSWYRLAAYGQYLLRYRLKEFYRRELNTMLLRNLADYIGQNLEIVKDRPPLDSSVYRAIGSYLLLFEHRQTQTDYIMDYLRSTCKGADGLSEKSLKELEVLIHDLLVENVTNDTRNVVLENDERLQEFIKVFDNISASELVYAMEKLSARNGNVIDLKIKLGIKFQSVFEFKAVDNELSVQVDDTFDVVDLGSRPQCLDTGCIPWMFTAEGFMAMNEELTPLRVYQILNNFSMIRSEYRLDYSGIIETTQQVRLRYYEEYAAYWQRFLNSLSLRSFNGLDELGAAVQNLEDPVDGVLVNLKKLLGENLIPKVKLQEEDGQNNISKAKEFVADTEAKLTSIRSDIENDSVLEERKLVKKLEAYQIEPLDTTKISSNFTRLLIFYGLCTPEMLSSEAGCASQGRGLSSFEKILGGIKLRLVQIFAADDYGYALFKEALNFKTTSVNVALGMNNTIENTDIFEQITINLATNYERLVFKGAKNFISEEWNNKIVDEFYSGMHLLFPFSPKAMNAVNPDEFSHFFGAKGTVSEFEKKYLAPWTQQSVDGTYSIIDERMSIAQAVLLGVQDCNRLKKMFFSENVRVPGFVISLIPHDMSSAAARFAVQGEGYNVEYSHGPRLKSLVKWQAGDDTVQFGFWGSQGIDNVRQEYHGYWGMLRILMQGTLQGRGEEEGYRYWCLKMGDHEIVYAVRIPSDPELGFFRKLSHGEFSFSKVAIDDY